MLLMSRDYVLAAELYRTELLTGLETALLTPTERKEGKRLVAKGQPSADNPAPAPATSAADGDK